MLTADVESWQRGQIPSGSRATANSLATAQSNRKNRNLT